MSTRNVTAFLGRSPLVLGSARDVGASLFFLLVTLVVTHPLVFSISSRVAACCDVWYFYWHTWWTKEALLGLRHNQFFTDRIFYPSGTNLPFESLSNSIFSALVSPIFGGVAAFNLLYLSSYVLGAFGTYLLVVRLTGDRRAGIVAGVVFAFSAVRSQNLQFTNMSAIQWLPLLALWVLKMIESPTTGRAVVCAVFFALAVLSSGYYGVSASILVVVLLAWNARRVVSFSFVKPLSVFFGVSAVALLPFTLPVIVESFSGDSFLRNSQFSRHFSADLVSFVLPSRFNPIYDSYVTDTYQRFITHFTESESYLGIVAVLLAALGAYRFGLRRTGPWVTVFILFAVLSLGPYLQFLGREFGAVPMPFAFLDDLPVFDAVRSPKRFLVAGMLGLAVLSGYGAHHLFSRNVTAWRIRPDVIVVVLVALVLTDYWGWPRSFVTSDATVPQFFRELSTEEGDIALLHIPVPNVANPKPMYYQTVHGKRLVGGYLQRPSPHALRLMDENAFLKGAALPQVEPRSSITAQESRDAETLFISVPQLKYVVLSKSLPSFPTLTSFGVYDPWLRERFGAPVYEDALIAAWRVGGR